MLFRPHNNRRWVKNLHYLWLADCRNLKKLIDLLSVNVSFRKNDRLDRFIAYPATTTKQSKLQTLISKCDGNTNSNHQLACMHRSSNLCQRRTAGQLQTGWCRGCSWLLRRLSVPPGSPRCKSISLAGSKWWFPRARPTVVLGSSAHNYRC